MNNIIAIIPARSGSKSIKNKNLQEINGKSLLQRAIEFASKIDKITKIIVSTDSPKYQKLAITYGAECPFLRPRKISRDDSLDIDVFKHCLKWLSKNQNYHSDIVLNMRPTYPFRDKKDFNYAIKKILSNKKIDSIKSVCKIPFPLEKTWTVKNKFYLANSIYKNFDKEYWNLPRQKLKKYYVQNGNIDILRASLILKNKMSGKKIFTIIQDHFYDIDSIKDIKNARKFKDI